jgi:hypothetical protein
MSLEINLFFKFWQKNYICGQLSSLTVSANYVEVLKVQRLEYLWIQNEEKTWFRKSL